MTFDEKCELIDKADELRLQGKTEEAVDLERKLPFAPHLAKAFKEVYGVETLTSLNLNLSEAEAIYGKDWLSK